MKRAFAFVPPQTIGLGPVEVRVYSLCLLAGIITGYYLAKPAALRQKISADTLQLSIFYGFIPGLLGARAYHVIDLWDYYLANPGQIAAIWNGGLGIFGGIVGGLIGLAVLARRKKLPLLTLLDVWAPSMLLAQAIGRLGNWANQEAFGQPTDLPWGVYIEPLHRPENYLADQYFHPAFLYEALWNLLGVIVLIIIRKRVATRPGTLLGLYFVWYGLGRFFIEFFRLDTAQTFGIATAHLLSAFMLVAGLYLIGRVRPARKRARRR